MFDFIRKQTKLIDFLVSFLKETLPAGSRYTKQSLKKLEASWEKNLISYGFQGLEVLSVLVSWRSNQTFLMEFLPLLAIITDNV